HEQALVIRERLARSDPRNAAWQQNLSISYHQLGELAQAENDLKAARAAHEKALALRERLARSDPKNSGWQQDLATSHERLGAVAEAEGNLQAAHAAYATERELGRKMVEALPDAPAVCAILGHACLKEAEVLAKIAPGTPKASLRAIMEEGRAPVLKLKQAGRLPPLEASSSPVWRLR
ncbi:MAG: hypothetical protein M3463_05520, partial [Verrucomicrobiota bacterium]|nr:hypothetical protein [Verrucomicrobiota bacterium]